MIQDSVNKVVYEGNGEATEFFYPFVITKNTDVKVMTVSPEGVETVLTNDYYVDTARSTVVYPGWVSGEEPGNQGDFSPLKDGWKLVVYREVSYTQEVAMLDQHPFNVLEGMIDKTTILAQQLKEVTDRSMKLSMAIAIDGVDTTVPYEAGKSFRWSETERKLETTEDPVDVRKVVENLASQVREQSTAAVTSAQTSADKAKESENEAKRYAEEAFIGVEQNKNDKLPIGHIYQSFNPNIPVGSLPLFGGEYSREAYADLWAWVQEQTGYLITEAEWQEKFTANGGNVPRYSDGDGSTTFRVPSISCWVKGANGKEEAGSYLQAGLPNVNGNFCGRTLNSSTGYGGLYYADGAFKYTARGANGTATGVTVGTTAYPLDVVNLDASRSSSVYGKSDEVQPKSLVGMWLVKAFGTVSNVGNQDIADISAGLTDIEMRLSKDYLPLAGGTMTGNLYSKTGELLGGFKNITTATNFNNLTTPGTYYLGYYAHTNSPADTAINGILIVEGQTGNDYIIQRFYRAGEAGSNSPAIFYRKKIGGTWSDWFLSEVCVESDIGANHGAFKLNSGLQLVWQNQQVTKNSTLTFTFRKPFTVAPVVVSAQRLDAINIQAWTTTNVTIQNTSTTDDIWAPIIVIGT